MTGAALLEVDRVSKHFRAASASIFGAARFVKAVDDVSFTLAKGETLGLVGESGSGKSTLGRLILRLVPASAGAVRWRGENVLACPPRQFKPYRRLMQMIFQDPLASLNPRYTIAQLIEEPLIVHAPGLNRAARREKALDLLAQVGLDRAAAGRYPHEFSGGQRQRIGIARALAVSPELIVADEPVSALDVSVQAQILNLLRDVGDRFGLSYLFIAHDLAVVKHMSRRVAVMYFGAIVETAPVGEIFARPAHPYTKMLLESVPRARAGAQQRRAAQSVMGEIPSPYAPPAGCAFHTRCPYKMAVCAQVAPQAREVAPGHFAACHAI